MHPHCSTCGSTETTADVVNSIGRTSSTWVCPCCGIIFLQHGPAEGGAAPSAPTTQPDFGGTPSMKRLAMAAVCMLAAGIAHAGEGIIILDVIRRNNPLYWLSVLGRALGLAV